MCPVTNRIAGFGSHACIWITSETLEPVFHRNFIWHLTGREDSYGGNEPSNHVSDESTDEITDENTAGPVTG